MRPVVLGARRRVGGTERRVPFYRSADLILGQEILGPAVLLKSDTTVVLMEGDRALVDPYRNLIIEVGPPGPGRSSRDGTV
jgi:N-methylhydantoinase A/oxoprolinase/acetone carboxylase beta subunit